MWGAQYMMFTLDVLPNTGNNGCFTNFFFSLLTNLLLTRDGHLTLSYPCGLVLDWYVLTAQFGHLTHGLWWFTDARPCFFFKTTTSDCRGYPLTKMTHVFPTAILTLIVPYLHTSYICSYLSPFCGEISHLLQMEPHQGGGGRTKEPAQLRHQFTHCALVGRWLTWMAWSFRSGRIGSCEWLWWNLHSPSQLFHHRVQWRLRQCYASFMVGRRRGWTMFIVLLWSICWRLRLVGGRLVDLLSSAIGRHRWRSSPKWMRYTWEQLWTDSRTAKTKHNSTG